MSKTFKKVISVSTSVTTILWLSGVAALAPLAASAAVAGILEGDTIRVANTLDVYIVKYMGAKNFKRLVLSPSVFNSYQHLSWSRIKTVTQAQMDQFTTSTLVRAVGDPKVYSLVPVPNSDNGSKQWVNMTAEAFTAAGYDWDSVYQINTTDRDVYTPGADITGGTSASTSTTVTPGVAGTVTVSLASDTPAAGIAPLKAARVPFTKFALTAGATDVTVTAIKAQRTGLAADTALSSVALIDNTTNLQIGLNQTLNADHQITVRESFTIPANTTKYYTLAANMPSTSQSAAGQTANLALVSVETTATVSGVLPITGNSQTINETLSIGSYTVASGSLNAATSTNKEVGTNDFNFSGVKFTAGSIEDLTITSIRFNQSGSAASSDLGSVVVSDGTTNYATTVSSDGKYFTASFGTAGITIAKGLSKEFTVKGNILSGSARTISFDIYRTTDVVIKGNVYGYYLTPDANTTYPWNTAGNPVFNANDITVGTGSLRIDKSSTGAPAANITKGATGVLLGSFDFVVAGEPINVASMILKIATSSLGVGNITNMTLTKADGTILAGPVDAAYASAGESKATFTGTVTFPVGTTQVLVKGNLATTLTNDGTIAVGFNTPGDKITSITGGTTGNSITATPATQVTGNTMTVKGGSLVVSVSGTPVAQEVIRGIVGYTFANLLFDATASGEDVKVTVVEVQDTIGEAGVATDISTLQLWDGTTALNTGSNVTTLAGTAGAANQTTITLDSAGVIIPKGTSKTLALKGNIAGNATTGSTSTHAWGLKASPTITATGVSTTLTITATGVTVAQAGQAMTIAAGGQYSVVLDSSTPTGKLIAGNTTGNTMTVLKFKATAEQINVTKVMLALTNASSSANDLSKVYIYDGATLLASGTLGTGDAVGLTNNASTTFTLSPALVLAPNVDKIVTIKADIAPILTTNTVADAGHQIAIDYYGSTSTTYNMGTGQSSGASIANYSPTTAQTSAYIYKSVPTVSTVALDTNTLTNGTMDLYRFKVSADAKGDIDLVKFTFTIATTSQSVLGAHLSIKDITLVDITESAQVTLNATTTNTQFYADMGGVIDIYTYAAAATWGTATTTRTVSAGTSRTFALRGTIAGAGSGASVTTYLMGDAAAPTSMSAGMVTFDNAELDASDDFIWSDVSSASHDTTPVGSSITDWTNGYLVSGLPSSNLTAQTLSK